MTMNASPPRRKFGCWFYGCTTLAVFLLAGLVFLFFLTRYAMHKVESLVQAYTDTNAIALERVELPPADWTNLQQRVSAFAEALNKGGSPAELALTAVDLNALIAQDPKFKELRDRVQVIITNGALAGKISYPLQDIGPLKLQGRYLNGSATFSFALEEGRLDVRLKDVEVKGERLPSPFLRELRKANLAENAQQDAETAANLAKFESIQIRDGQVVLRSKSATTSPP